jgi:SAM-dependent methyltransferase
MSDLRERPVILLPSDKDELRYELDRVFIPAREWIDANGTGRDDGFPFLSAEEIREIGYEALEASNIWEIYRMLAKPTSRGDSRYDAIIGVQHVQAYKEMVKLMRQFETRFADQALDIACGTGGSTQVLLPFCSHITGVDILPEMLEWAEKRFRKKRGLKCRFLEMDIFNHTLPLDSFDVVVLNGFAQYMSPEEAEYVFPPIIQGLVKVGGRVYEYDDGPRGLDVYMKSPRGKLAAQVGIIINSSTFIKEYHGWKGFTHFENYGFEGGYYDIEDRRGAKLSRVVRVK